MRENFERYRTELDRVRLTDESKQALAESLACRGPEGNRAVKRRPLGLGRIAAAAAVLCLLVTGAVAAAVGSPTLRDRVFGDSAGYSQSSGFVGKSVEKDGWTVAITDCVGDDVNLYVGLEVTAPEGTVLDEESGYRFGKSSSRQIEFPDLFFRFYGSYGIEMLPDDDPTDNRIAFMVYVRSGVEMDGYNGVHLRLVLPGLYHWGGWDAEAKQIIYAEDCGATWDFGTVTISYPNSTVHLEPGVTVTTLDVEAAVTEIDVSPLCVRVKIEGDSLQGHHSWVPKDAPDHWYSCIDYQEVTLYAEDGSVYPVTMENSDLSMSGCGGGEGDNKDGYVVLRRAYGREKTNPQLIDVDSLTAISVCGVMIPLR